MIQNLLNYYLAHVCSISISFQMFLNNYHLFYQIMHWHYNIKIFCIIYLCIVYFAYAVSKWCTVLKYYSFISFICFYCYCISFCSYDCELPKIISDRLSKNSSNEKDFNESKGEHNNALKQSSYNNINLKY